MAEEDLAVSCWIVTSFKNIPCLFSKAGELVPYNTGSYNIIVILTHIPMADFVVAVIIQLSSYMSHQSALGRPTVGLSRSLSSNKS